YEEQYPDMAEATGTKNGKTVEFDLTDPKFVNAYFEVLHNPYEECGVDSWWIDWQQGTKTKIKGYDPLWGLNHYHYLNSMRNGARGLILSRYAGLGSHRYPLGFSGDAFIVWKSLKFQPYFTANSSNAGYPMWSHDIGGHMSLRVWRYLKRTVSEPTANEYNAELFLRWAQFGVFSPIMRLHSTKMGTGKEPWKFPPQTERLKDALNLRMRLVPYIYTMVKRTEDIGRALIEPLYYDYSNEKGAFKAKREYLFGSELIVAPITSKSQNGLSKTKVWLPKGQFKDIFTHEIIASRGGFTEVSRDFNSIPVFAKEGSIIPLAKPEGNSTKNPKELDIICYKGNGVFKLYEDDSETLEYKNGKFLTTVFELKDAEDNQPPTLKISTEGDLSFAPNGRIFNIIFHDFNKKEPIKIISGVKAGETAILG
ncbi:MAG: DUF5110 domain-containing protein, partial [Firmicutes bacterium]|nr:DUF5110 domain-containing protein [Bacillota bacterium]